MYIDVYPMLRMAANVGMRSHGYWALNQKNTQLASTFRYFPGPWDLVSTYFWGLKLPLVSVVAKKSLRHRFAFHRGIAHVLKQPCVHGTWNHFWPERDDVQKFKHRRRAGSNFHREWLHLVHSNEKVIVYMLLSYEGSPANIFDSIERISLECSTGRVATKACQIQVFDQVFSWSEELGSF